MALRKDGSLDEAAVERNLARLPEERRRPALVDALNELLYAELLAVKRTLGADHETRHRPRPPPAAVSRPDAPAGPRGGRCCCGAVLLLVLWRLWPLL